MMSKEIASDIRCISGCLNRIEEGNGVAVGVMGETAVAVGNFVAVAAPSVVGVGGGG